MAGWRQYHRARWLRYGGLCVLSVLVFLGASFLHERALEDAVANEVHRAVVFADDTIAPLVQAADLRRQLPSSVANDVTAKLQRDVLTGSSVVRIRIFASDGTLIYSTDDGDRLGTRSAGDPQAVRAATQGRTGGFEDTDRVSADGQIQSIRLLSTYVPVSGSGGPDGVLSVDQRYRPIEEDTSQPWRTLQLVGLAGAVVFLELCLLWFARHISATRLASRSGFQPMDGTPARAKVAKDARADEKQAKAREALEAQLETLRAQVAAHDQDAAAMRTGLEERLRDAERRAAEAAGTGDAAVLQAAKDRASDAEQKLTKAESRLAEAEARVTELVTEVRMLTERPAAAQAGPAGDPEELRRLREQLDEQTRRAEEQEQRARDALAAVREQDQASASVEAALAELDAKLANEIAEHRGARARLEQAEAELADLRSRADDAADLAREGGRRLEEATAAGDAARDELTRVIAERDALQRRVAELDAAAADATRTSDREGERTDGDLGPAGDLLSAAEAERTALQEELTVVKRARDDAERAIGDAEARAQAAESRLAAAASDRSTEAATLAAELDAERERLRRSEERAVEAERRGDEMDRHASSIAQALEDERVGRDRARIEAADARAELERRDADHAATIAELEARLQAEPARVAEQASAPSVAAEDAELRRANQTLREELDSMGLRLRRAYADAEEARAQLAAAPPAPPPVSLADVGGPASADGIEEIQRLRLELGRAVERANAAEARLAQLQEDRGANGTGEAPADRDPGGATTPDEERSLRFRLAKSAARKKGIDAPGGSDTSMWS